MNSSKFPIHGHLALSLDDRVLVISGKGPANIEMIQHYQSEVLTFKESLKTGPWASLVLLQDLMILPPDAKKLMLEVVKTPKELKLVATAIVIMEKEYPKIVERFWRDIYSNSTVPCQFFNNEADARSWLTECLSSVSLS